MRVKNHGKKPIQYLESLKVIAHRLGYAMTSHPENSLEAVEEIFQKDELLDACNGFEFDICFTKDNIPVVIHDRHIDDVAIDGTGLVKDYTLYELKQLTFEFRKSLKKDSTCSFKIVSLEELLQFFSDNSAKLGHRIIKIETKEPCYFDTTNLEALAEILNKFPTLAQNIIHLSFWPQNLRILQKIQSRKGIHQTPTDLLCDFKTMVTISKYFNWLDGISLRVKTRMQTKPSKDTPLKVNMQIAFERLCMLFTNAANQASLEYALERFGQVGIYVINTQEDLEALAEIITKSILKEKRPKITITSNNPLYLKRAINK